MWAIAAIAVLALMTFLVHRSFRDLVSEARSKIKIEMTSWRLALVGERRARSAHDLVALARRPMKDAITVLQGSGRDDLAREVDVRLQECEALSRPGPSSPSQPHLSWGSSGAAGFLGGYTENAPSRSGSPLRLFSAEGNLAPWLPKPFAQELARFLRPVDVVRLLHTPELERRSIVTMLQLRVLILLIAPLLGGLNPGPAPLSGKASTVANVIYLCVLAEGLVTALFAKRIAAWVIGRPVRWSLFLIEQSLAVMLLLAFPSWACCAYAAGPIVWFEKQDWSLHKLIAWLSVTLGAMVISLWGEPWLPSLATLVASVCMIGLIADSYGLMLPAVVTTAWSGWRESRRLRHESSDRDRELRAVMSSGLAFTRRAVEDASAQNPDSRAELLQSLARAEARIEADGGAVRNEKTLESVCARAIASAGIPPAVWDSGAEVQATEIQARPRELAALRLSSRHQARKLVQLLAGFAREAGAHGLGLLETRIIQDGPLVVIQLANELNPQHLPGTSSGTAALKGQASRLEGVTVDIAGEVEFDGMPMWLVNVRLDPTCFRRT